MIQLQNILKVTIKTPAHHHFEIGYKYACHMTGREQIQQP